MDVPSAKRLAAVLAVTLAAATGSYAVVQAYDAFQDDEELARVCSTIKETEKLYAKQRAEAAGPAASVSVLGDSYAEGLYLSTPMSAYPYVLAEALQESVTVHGVGGTGYVAGGPCGGGRFSTRLDEALASRPSTLIIQAGINDRGKEGVQQAASSLLSAAKRQAPNTRIVVVGPFTPEAAAGPELDEVAEAIESAAAQAGVQYVDPSDWVYTLNEDRLHPSENGHRVIGTNLARALAP